MKRLPECYRWTIPITEALWASISDRSGHLRVLRPGLTQEPVTRVAAAIQQEAFEVDTESFRNRDSHGGSGFRGGPFGPALSPFCQCAAGSSSEEEGEFVRG